MVRPAATCVVATVLLAGFALAAPARADLGPPAGKRSVSFQVRVEGLTAFPEMVLVVYPHSLSDGAPTTEHAVLRDGQPLPVGRRSATPKLWAVTKSDYEEFAATYQPTFSSSDPALEAFFASGKARDCGVTIRPVFELPLADPRASALQSFHADAIEPSRCQLTPGAPPHRAPTDTGASAGGDGPPSTTGGGCARCSTDPGAGDRWIGGAAVAIWLLGVAVARRRRTPGS
jgi:MYXO-CTERM domain-containing protein